MALPIFSKNKKQFPQQQEMGFIDHLEALRWHLVRSVIAVAIIGIVLFINIDWVFDHIIYGPLRPDFITYSGLCKLGHNLHLGEVLCMPPPNVQMQVTEFGTQFMSSISISIFGGFIIGFPYIFWEFWKFVKPALSQRELNNTRGAIFWVTFFFILGISFGYFLLAPFTFSFLANYKIGTMQALETKPTLNDYIENMTNLLIGTGIAFELPVISFVLTKVGLISSSFLQEYRKYAYVFILVLAALITPSPDWISQTLVAVPLFILFEISIIISKRVENENLQKEKEFFNS